MIPIVVVTLLLAALTGVQAVSTCNATSACTLHSAPCCSEYGFCGKNNFCLGGCNPFGSKELGSCKPEPLCQDKVYTFTDKSRILSNATKFDGNSTKYDWVVDKGSSIDSDGDLGLILTEENGGTRISSTKYVHYGDITATLKTGRWDGVVVAFITMSDIKDEIDWEFPGKNTTHAQSNFFWQGNIPDLTAGDYHPVSGDTFGQFHDYNLHWTSDELTWSIDGKAVRTVKKSDTVDSAGVAHYPSTPSRIQFSIWPAGIPGTAPGTVEWAGGMINWDDEDYKAAGHFYTIIKQVEVKCINAQAISPNSNVTSYVYGGDRSLANTPTVLYTNQSTLLNAAGRLEPSVAHGAVLVATIMGVLMGANALLL